MVTAQHQPYRPYVMYIEEVFDNAVSKTPYWAWEIYDGQSKLQKIILYILHERNMLDADVWRGAQSLKSIKHLLFKDRQLTASERASFSRTIRRLEIDGLISRERSISDNGYTSHVGLTQRGYNQVETDLCWPLYREELAKLFSFYGLKSTKYYKKVNNIR